MIKGKELGAAIALAIQLKIDAGLARSKAAVARDLEVEPNVVYGWIRTGSISKERLPALWSYFADVVGPEHWGLSTESMQFLGQDSNLERQWPFKLTRLEDVLSLSAEQLQQLDHIVAGVLMGLRSNRPSSPPMKSKGSGKSAA